MAALIVLYYFVIIAVCIKIVYDTDTPSKAMSYLFLVLFLPIFGVIFYFSIGVNYRKRKLYRKKLDSNQAVFHGIEEKVETLSQEVLGQKQQELGHFLPMAKMIGAENTFTTKNNSVHLYTNGEEKFPEVLKSMAAAKHHIHIEYYIFENGDIGSQIGELLIKKAQEGVEIRFIYDGFGSKEIHREFLEKLKNAGVEIAGFYKIRWLFLANSLNYRNHRKIIVVDGLVGFVGGINVSDKYINNEKSSLFWRDTHIKIEGSAMMNLQYIFLTDWNFCAKKDVGLTEHYFPMKRVVHTVFGSQLVQVVSSGPDSKYPRIMYAQIHAINLSRKEICLTTPYFIPEKSFLDALIIAKLSGVDVKILVPGISDSSIVNASSNSNYLELLKAGIEIYKYEKGFVHAKTMVCDSQVSMVGTANVDQRSFDLNFEVNAIVYDNVFAQELRSKFYEDLKDAEQIILEEWIKRPLYIILFERVMRLFSSLM